MSDYYRAYDARYRTAHAHGVTWMSDRSTPIVAETLIRYGVGTNARLLEIGCGEGRDAAPLLERGYDLYATDCSPEAIAYCKRTFAPYADRFAVLDVLRDAHDRTYDFIFAVAVLHMLVRDADRDGLYSFLRTHLAPGGVALLCTMGDGTVSMQTDPAEAFLLRKRCHPSGPMLVAATSCRMVTTDALKAEIARNGLQILDIGLTSAPPDFDCMQYVILKK